MLVVKRGGEPQYNDQTELEAYIASLLRLENVGILLGAGASVPAGGLIMTEIWEEFKESYKDSYEWLQSNKFIASESEPNPEEESEPNPEEESEPNPERKISCPNIENLIDKLSITIHEWGRVENKNLEMAEKSRANLLRAIIKAVKLDGELWKQSTSPFNASNKLSSHQRILQKVTSARQPGQSAPWIFTTNYDLLVEWAAESIEMSVINGFLGIHNRHFSPQIFDLGFRNTKARGEASFGTYNIYLVKLHGSLNWKENEGDFFEVQATETLNIINDFLSNNSNNFELLVYPSANKYDQTNGYLFGELFRKFGEFMSQPQTVLFVVGYSFGDDHINRYLKSALLNPTLQIVIYFPEYNQDTQLSDYPKCLQQIISLNNPRVTLIGGGKLAFIQKFAEHLPDPTIYDENFQQIKKILNSSNNQSESNGFTSS